ncbi:MAG: 30S ribosomal protein S9 [Candidatus Micrarchaeaceae archaeon]
MAEDTDVKTEEAPAPEQAAKRRATAKKKASKKQDRQIVFVKSKRKRAIARASAKSGSGRIRINGYDINMFEPLELRRLMLEPVHVSSSTHEAARRMDIDINVYGGGQSSQAQAVRGAIAKSISESSDGDSVKKEYMAFDRFMLIDDTRRVEPKKFKGPKARARFQKSYR